jgi:hypothetical protein
MALPSDADVELLLCDAVRRTPEGKLDLAGYFPVHEVKLDSSAPLPAAMNLGFVFVLKGGDGIFHGAFRILDPVGQELHRSEVAEFTKQPGFPHVIMFLINRIPVARAGNFTVVLELGDREYRRPVRVFQ